MDIALIWLSDCLTGSCQCYIYLQLIVVDKKGNELERISPWATYVVQNSETKLMEPIYWNPLKEYKWMYPRPGKRDDLRIYETHVGISSEDYAVASYTHFKDKVIPHILYLGYNCVQIMAIMEHAYYASFGYQVTSFFAPSRYVHNICQLVCF